VGLGVSTSNTQIMFTQGSLMPGINTDAAIQGDGFFQVDLPGGGVGYTRAGNFVRNATGELVLGNSFGYKLKDTPTIPQDVADTVSIGSDGKISAIRNGKTEQIGQITLARFQNPSGLIQYGANVYLESGASGQPLETTPGENGSGLIQGGQLELSTTEAVTELVELIKTQRVFQMNSQTIQAADESLQTVANLRR
jgi:flagellar basal-body rod protein FlgG